jgi:transposase
MSQNFIECDREQAFLLPPSLLEWLPEEHLVWTVLGAVEQMDLDAIYSVYRQDGHGRPAYEPAMMGGRAVVVWLFGRRAVLARD